MKADVYSRKTQWKIALVFFGIFIGVATLIYTESFIGQLRTEEEKKIMIWAKAVKEVFYADANTDLSFASEVLQNNTTIPVILTDSAGAIIAHRNINVPDNSPEDYLQKKLEEFKSDGTLLTNTFGDSNVNYLYYKGSTVLEQLRLYPMILLGAIAVYLLISYMAFSNARRSEQNKVWTGMAKETAHQIGTPLSALMGWIAYLKGKYPEEQAFGEMEQDVERLHTITDRFSKIGSQPELKLASLSESVEHTVDYLTPRIPSKIELTYSSAANVECPINIPLLSWVLENLINNAVDAMPEGGKISVLVEQHTAKAKITVTDTGKGIPLAIQRAVFNPGFTSKKRGWGLGLSLAKRIVEEYHDGRLSLQKSEAGVGTTFTIELPLI